VIAPNTHPNRSPRPQARRRRPPFDSRLSLMLDRATVQLEAATDPEIIAVYSNLVEELERIALGRGKA
jgi:hypothetical protein